MKHEIQARVGQLVSSLSLSEKEVLFKHLHATLPEWQNQSKLAELLEELYTDPASENIHYSRKNFDLLENRILDSLLFDINLNRKGKFNDDGNATLSLRKEALKMRVLQKRGVLHRAYKMAQNVKQQALLDEDYDSIIESLNLQLSMIGLQQDAQKFKELTEQINHFEYHRFAKRKSLALLYELKMKKFYGLTENLDLFVKDSIMTLQRYQERVHCRTIDFVHGFFIKEDFELEDNWLEAHYYMSQLFTKAEELPRNTPHFNFWELVFEQGRLCIKTGDAENGLFLLEKCLKQLPPEHLAYQQSVEMAFFTLFHKKDFRECRKLLDGYRNTHFYQRYLSKENQHHWNFRLACLLYHQGKIEKVKKLLEQCHLFEKSGVQQALNVRFLKIIVSIDEQKTDLADHYLESLRKHISRHSWQAQMKELNLYPFYYSLLKLRNTGYRFAEFSQRYPEHIEELTTLQQDQKECSIETLPLISYWHWVKKGSFHQNSLPQASEKFTVHRKVHH